MRLSRLLIVLLLGTPLARGEAFLPFGREGLTIPPSIEANPATPRLVELIAAQLRVEQSPARRARLVRDLGATRLAEAVGPVVAALGDPFPSVRAEAASALLALNARDRADAIRPLLADADPAVRASATASLVGLGARGVVAAALSDQAELVQLAAVTASREPDDLDAIVAAWPRLSAVARRSALRQLGQQKATRHADAVVAALQAKDKPTQVAALEALSGCGESRHADAVRPFLRSEFAPLRRAAVQTMGAIASPDANAIARQALGDADPEVRSAACDVLRRVPDATTVALLVEQLDDGYPPLHHAAREALLAAGQAGIESVVEQAVILLKGDDPRRQEDGSYLLGGLRRDDALERHIELTRSEDAVTAGQAARSLRKIGRREAAPAMVALYKRMRRHSAGMAAVVSGREAIVAAAELGARDILAATARIIPDIENEPAELRAAAVYAMGVLGAPGDEQLVRVLTGRLTNQMETGDVQFEAAKALGALKASSALPLLRELGGGSFDPALRYMAHRAADHIEGKTTPFVPATVERPLELLVEEVRDAPEPRPPAVGP